MYLYLIYIYFKKLDFQLSLVFIYLQILIFDLVKWTFTKHSYCINPIIMLELEIFQVN